MSDLVLDGLDINDAVNYVTSALDLTPPAKKLQWASSADASGAALLGEPEYEQRTINLVLRVMPQTTMNLAADKAVAFEDKLQKAERTLTGIPLIWTPPRGTYSFTFYVLAGEIVELPLEATGESFGFSQRTPVLGVRLDCRPFGYGVEVTSTTTTNTLSLQELLLSGVPGDVPAECKVIVTDASGSEERMHVEVGRETAGYNATTPSDLVIEKGNMVNTGFAGSTATRDSQAVWRAVLGDVPVTICRTTGATNQQNHVGTFRVKCSCAAFRTLSEPMGLVRVRLVHRVGSETPFVAGNWALPLLGNDEDVTTKWSEVDLGLIDVPPVEAGDLQTWQGRIEAESDTLGDQIDIRELRLIPAEQYGIGRGVRQAASATMKAYESFDSDALETSISGHTAGLGGSWQTYGDTSPAIGLWGPDTEVPG